MTLAYNFVTIRDIREILFESSGKNWTSLTQALKPFVIQWIVICMMTFVCKRIWKLKALRIFLPPLPRML